MTDPGITAAPLRFGRDRRLLTKFDFERVFKEGRRAFAKGLLVYVAVSPVAMARIGLVTSRRFGNAVHRNRARRLLRESFRLKQHELPPLDIVALPQGGFPDSMAGAQRALLEAIARATR